MTELPGSSNGKCAIATSSNSAYNIAKHGREREGTSEEAYQYDVIRYPLETSLSHGAPHETLSHDHPPATPKPLDEPAYMNVSGEAGCEGEGLYEHIPADNQ